MITVTQQVMTETVNMQIFVVDDDNDTRNVFRRFCEISNYKVTTAGSIDQTLEIVDSHAFDKTKKTIFVLDWCLPPSNAKVLVKELLARNLNAVYILVTGSNCSERDAYEFLIKIDSAYRTFEDILDKPVTMSEFLSTIQKYV